MGELMQTLLDGNHSMIIKCTAYMCRKSNFTASLPGINNNRSKINVQEKNGTLD